MRLPDTWVNKIVIELQGIYGQQFTGKYSKIEGGIDIGIANFKESLANRLGGFVDHPEAIGYALKNLPVAHCPNVLEFQAIANLAPKKQAPAIAYKPTEEDIERAKAATASAVAALKPKVSDGIDRHWATHPRSADQLRLIFEAAAKDHRFRSCISEMVSDGICTEDGLLLKQYQNQQFVSVSRKQRTTY